MRAAAATSFKKVSQALQDGPAVPCAVLLGDPAVRASIRRTLGGGEAPDAGVFGEVLEGLCLVEAPDPQTAEAATELATFLRGLPRTNGFVLACDESDEQIALETLMLLTGFYGIPLPWPHLAVAMTAAPSGDSSKREVALRRRLRCDSATFTTGKVNPPGKLSIFLLGGGGKGSKNVEGGKLKSWLKNCKPLKCDPLLSMSPLMTQYRAITEKLDKIRISISSPRRPPAGQRFQLGQKAKSPKGEDGSLPQLSANGRLLSAGSGIRQKQRSSSDGASLYYSDGTTHWGYGADSSQSSQPNYEILPPLYDQMYRPYATQPRFMHGMQESMFRSASEGQLTPPGSRQGRFPYPQGGHDVSRHQFQFGVGASRNLPMSHPMRNVGSLPYLSTTHQRMARSENDFSGSGYGRGWSDGGYDRWQYPALLQQPKQQLSQTYHDRWYSDQWSGWRGGGWSSRRGWHDDWWDESWQKGQQSEQKGQQSEQDKSSKKPPSRQGEPEGSESPAAPAAPAAVPKHPMSRENYNDEELCQ